VPDSSENQFLRVYPFCRDRMNLLSASENLLLQLKWFITRYMDSIGMTSRLLTNKIAIFVTRKLQPT
ncbi:MAG TPA: hypothetical protein PK825_08585, partial [Bacteroidales bacterium]|nr:hypothetical protein [Bacteroidales bacterium]